MTIILYSLLTKFTSVKASANSISAPCILSNKSRRSNKRSCTVALSLAIARRRL